MDSKIRSNHLKLVGMLACVVGLAMVLNSCGSGDGGGEGAPPAAGPLAGVFIDSPVQGLGYLTSSGLSGTTNANGQFNYNAGDTVTFTLFGRTICTNIPTAPVITGLSCFGATSLTDARVVNLSQLLLTLGGIPTGQNPIQLPATPPANFPATIDFSAPGFDTSFPGLTLVSEGTATSHLQAQFSTVSVTLTGSAPNSGTVTSNPSGINCGATCSAVFTNGTAITLTATGTGFAGWSGGTGSATGCNNTTGPCSFTLTGSSTITATFNAPPPPTLGIASAGTGVGVVECSVNGGAFVACAASYPNGTPLVLRATANAGSTFIGWTNGSGNAQTCNGTVVNCSMTLTANTTVTATFNLIVMQTVTGNIATTNGGGGTVQCSAGGGAPGPCTSYPSGTAITMTATPNSVSNFTGWSNGSGNATVVACNGTTTPCQFTLTANTSITANFNLPVLSVVVSGTGSVSSNPAGINNCTTNCSAPFNKGTQVTLTASGTGFTGWSGGGCSGTGTCVVTLNANTTVTATFGTVSTATSYKFVFAEGGALMAIDPAAPTTPITVAPSGVIASDFVLSGTYDAGTQSFSNVQAPIQVFARNGSFWRVNSAKSAGVPGTQANLAIQISNETGATSLCDFVVLQTGSTSTTRIVYEFPGADTNCNTRNDNISKLVPVLAAASAIPFTLPTGTTVTGDESPIFDLTTGQAMAVFLTDHLNSNSLNRLDLGNNDVSAILSNVGTVEFLVQDTSDRVFIRNNNTLYLDIHTGSGDTLTPLLTTASPLHCGGVTCSDGTSLFVFEDAGKVYQVPLSATSSANVITLINSTTTPLLDMAVTNTRLILGTGTFAPGSSRGLFSMAKSPGAAQTTLTTPAVDNIFNIMGTANNLVYYQRFEPSGAQTAVVVQDDGGAVATHANSIWNGIVAGGTFGIRTGDIGLSKIVRTALGSSSSDPFNGATAFAYAAASPLTAPISLGPVPTTTPSLQGLAFAGIADSVLLGFGPLGLTSNNAVLFADTAVSNSLVRVPLLDASWNVSGL